MRTSPAQQALAAAAVSLVVWGACVLAFLPPFNVHALGSVPLAVALGLALAISTVLHLTFVGIAARRLGRSPALWVALALVTLPVGSIVGLILLEWYADERNHASTERAA